MKDIAVRVRSLASWFALSAALALAGCGGGGGGSAPETAPAPAPPTTEVAGAPAATGDTATDGFNRFNFRRQQAGLPALARNAAIDAAAQGHSNYQKANDVTTHEQEPGKPGFTGVTEGDRLRAAGYALPANGYAYGEVISTRSDPGGAAAAEDLVAAIYHRFLVLEPMYREGGAGAATTARGTTYFTSDLATIGLAGGLSRGGVAVYPSNAQADVPAGVNTDEETPDPVPNINRVGYPASVHANLTSALAVKSFTITQRGGPVLATRLLVHANDPETPASAAAAIPLSALLPGTTYDAAFVGTVDGLPVSRNWSFTTQ